MKRAHTKGALVQAFYKKALAPRSIERSKMDRCKITLEAKMERDVLQRKSVQEEDTLASLQERVEELEKTQTSLEEAGKRLSVEVSLLRHRLFLREPTTSRSRIGGF